MAFNAICLTNSYFFPDLRREIALLKLDFAFAEAAGGQGSVFCEKTETGKRINNRTTYCIDQELEFRVKDGTRTRDLQSHNLAL